MSKLPSRLTLTVLMAGASVCVAAAPVAAQTYLGWSNKAAVSPGVPAPPVNLPQAQPRDAGPVRPASPAGSSAPAYAIPPSPYGQVGYPFKTLSWSAKDGDPQAQVETVSAPMPVPQPYLRQSYAAQPTQAPSRPVARPEPRPELGVASAPPPPPQPRTIVQNGRTYVLPSGPQGPIEPEDDPDYSASVVSQDASLPVQKPPVQMQPVQMQAVQAPPMPAAPQVAVRDLPPSAPVQAPAPQPQASGGYQVPATSKYAARIAAARQAAGVAQDIAPATAPAPASAPAYADSLAAQETDHVFIPGELSRSAADEPRLYSLHRAYGYRPDPITVDHNASGGLLVAHLDTEDADEGASDTRLDTDSGANAPNPAKPSDDEAQ